MLSLNRYERQQLHREGLQPSKEEEGGQDREHRRVLRIEREVRDSRTAFAPASHSPRGSVPHPPVRDPGLFRTLRLRPAHRLQPQLHALRPPLLPAQHPPSQAHTPLQPTTRTTTQTALMIILYHIISYYILLFFYFFTIILYYIYYISYLHLHLYYLNLPLLINYETHYQHSRSVHYYQLWLSQLDHQVN